MNHLADAWEALADADPEAAALRHGGRVRTWREFDDRASRLAQAMVGAGLGPGSRVMIALYNCSEYLETFFAAIKIRATPANMNYRYVGREAQALLEKSRAVALVYHASLRDRLADVVQGSTTLRFLVEVDDTAEGTRLAGIEDYEELVAASAPAPRIARSPDDFVLSFTGGTTGLPKAVVSRIALMTGTAMGLRGLILQEDIAPDAPVVETARQLRQAGRSPVGLPASPLMHSTGLGYASFPSLTAGGCVVTLPNRSFDAAALLAEVEAARATTIAIVGDAFARPIVDALRSRAATGRPHDLSSLRCIASAGVAWSAEVKQELLDFLPQVALCLLYTSDAADE